MREDKRGGVTARAVLAAGLLLAAVAVANFLIEAMWGYGSWTGVGFSSGVPVATPFVVLVLLTIAGSLPLLRRAAFTRRELLAIYAMLLVGAPALTHAVLVWMLVKNIAYYYMAQVETHWPGMFLKQMPTWWAPTDLTAAVNFFEGESKVPWAAWAVPLLGWGSFLVALFVCSICATALLQHQWVTNERLSFPFAQLPLELVSARHRRTGGGGARLTAVPVFWIGFGLSLGLGVLSGLAERFPSVPHFSTFWYEVIPWQPVGPLAGLGAITVCLWPWMIGLAFLIPKDLSFSFWFFSLIRYGLTVIAIAAGATPQQPQDFWSTAFPAPYYQGGGAMLGLFVWTLWLARAHLARAFRIALRGSRQAEAQEPLSFRWAFAGLLVSFAYMAYFFVLSGCRLVFGIALIAAAMSYFIMWARLRAENGMSFLAFPIQIQSLMYLPVGAQSLRVTEIITIITMRWAYTPGFDVSSEVLACTSLEAFKIADAARLNARRLTVAMIAGFVLSVVVGMAIFMTGVYRYGWFGLSASRGGWLGPQSIGDGNSIVWLLTDPSVMRPDWQGMGGLLCGAAVAVFLGLMRLRFWWWPFHPMGYLASNTWGFHWYALPFFIGWLLKAVVIRYGGLRLYRAVAPLAVGLIAGDLINVGVWSAVKIISQGRV
jgi:hypothetical protein